MSERNPQQFSDQRSVLAMHGPDGSGKTTIGERVGEHLDQTHGDTLVIGSSGFLHWLDRATYQRFIGDDKRLEIATSATATAAEKTAFYEDIPICLYGVAAEHATNRGHVVVHSDPYLKRLTWARRNMSDDEFLEYADRFEEHIASRIGDTYASHAALIHADASESFSRIEYRGPVSEYDPATEAENQELVDAVSFVEDFAFGSKPRYSRLHGVEVITIENPEVPKSDREMRIELIATRITNFVCEQETS